MVYRGGLKSTSRAGPIPPFGTADFRELADAAPGPCVSLFLPTHRNANGKKEDRVRFKNLLKGAEERLARAGLRTAVAAAILEPARRLLAEDEIWEHTLDGLAVFAAADAFHYYGVARPLRELLAVGPAYHLKPLLPEAGGDHPYYVLGLTQKRTALLEGRREGLKLLDVPGLPADLATALGLETFPPERQLQLHNLTSNAGRRDGIYHGHAEEADILHRYLREYFQRVDQAVSAYLRGRRAPLLLATVEKFQGLYRPVNTYPRLLAEGVRGNPEDPDVDEFHRQTLEVIERHQAAMLDYALREYRETGGGPRSSEELSTVVQAAWDGRVERLFVAEDVEVWGAYEPDVPRLAVHAKAEPGDRDLLDLAAVRTVLTEGRVYLLPRAKVPRGAPAAALFRY